MAARLVMICELWVRPIDDRLQRLTDLGGTPGQSDILLNEHAEKMVQEMPDCRLEVVEGAGHSVMGDNPKGFLEAVRPFLLLLTAGGR